MLPQFTIVFSFSQEIPFIYHKNYVNLHEPKAINTLLLSKDYI